MAAITCAAAERQNLCLLLGLRRLAACDGRERWLVMFASAEQVSFGKQVCESGGGTFLLLLPW